MMAAQSSRMSVPPPPPPQVQTPDRPASSGSNTFVLCLDGTGNKFSGTDSDSNILKIYRMLDRTRPNQYVYYQPGIGTYVNTSSLEHTSISARFKSWYGKAKDSAVGSSFGEHVMSAYRFLMRYYSTDDEIYMFGFSRGAYTCRFLAMMLDYVGLLPPGSEELVRFVWKAFSKWQARSNALTETERKEEHKLYLFMKNFRETFSRPVRRIRFLGLFDVVNSVPRFEAAWMQRSKFPFSARSSAVVQRHAVSIDERRAKFRADLITGSKQNDDHTIMPIHRFQSDLPTIAKAEGYHGYLAGQNRPDPSNSGYAAPISTASTEDLHESANGYLTTIPEPETHAESTAAGPPAMKSMDELNEKYADAPQYPPQAPSANAQKDRRVSYAAPMDSESREHQDLSEEMEYREKGYSRRPSEVKKKQDIVELWFPGCHADIGGGWPKGDNESWALSHAPLAWIVKEAEKAGLHFDKFKIAALDCCPNMIDEYGNKNMEHEARYYRGLQESCTQGILHDCLKVGGGLPPASVVSWRIMEYLPFRRFDLQDDGSWRTIRWPLPCGEVRDMPLDARIHRSAIERMKHDPNYRPGNLIMGGGGRGMKKAPKELGIGEWEVFSDEGDMVRESFMRKTEMSKYLEERRNKRKSA